MSVGLASTERGVERVGIASQGLQLLPPLVECTQEKYLQVSALKMAEAVLAEAAEAPPVFLATLCRCIWWPQRGSAESRWVGSLCRAQRTWRSLIRIRSGPAGVLLSGSGVEKRAAVHATGRACAVGEKRVEECGNAVRISRHGVAADLSVWHEGESVLLGYVPMSPEGRIRFVS